MGPSDVNFVGAVNGEEHPIRRVCVTVSGELFAHMFRKGNFTEITEGLPRGAEFIGMSITGDNRHIDIFFEHYSFKHIEWNRDIPCFKISGRAYNVPEIEVVKRFLSTVEENSTEVSHTAFIKSLEVEVKQKYLLLEPTVNISLDIKELVKISRIDDHLFRGPRPKTMKHLQELGFKRVITLQSGMYEEFHDDLFETEYAPDFGLDHVVIPCSDFRSPQKHEVLKFLKASKDKDVKTYVHCLHGKDRTGFMSAVYRMTAMQWDYESAKDEMLKLGFHKWAYWFWYKELKKWERNQYGK